jgi:hypothetical protein
MSVCWDKYNDEVTLKQILRSLVIEEKFAQELIPLLQIVSPFDPLTAACYEFNNSTEDCPSTNLNTCQRCHISIDKQPPPSQQICATCSQISDDSNSVAITSRYVSTEKSDTIAEYCQNQLSTQRM